MLNLENLVDQLHGSKFDDPCSAADTKITAVKISVGSLSGCPIIMCQIH